MPCSPAKLRTQKGYLFAELERGPALALGAVHKILRDGIKLAIGDCNSTFVAVLCYLVRLASRILSFARCASKASTITRQAAKCIKDFDAKICAWLDEASNILKSWVEDAATKRKDKDLAGLLHAHLALAGWRYAAGEALSAQSAAQLLASASFVKTW